MLSFEACFKFWRHYLLYNSWIYMQNHENQIVLEVICHTVKPF